MKARVITLLETFVFDHRTKLVVGFIALTVLMGWFASRTHVDASFKKSLPLEHPYIQTFTEFESDFGGANRVVIALMAKDGNIFTPEFFAALREATDAVFFLPGVDRAQVQSLFTPNVRYVEVVDDGFAGGNVIPADFTPTPANFARVKSNIIKSGKLGQLVANDFSGAIISAQLLEVDPATGERIDYIEVANALEADIRDQFEGWAVDVRMGVHIIGFAKVIGDISDGARNVLFFFGVAFVITGLLVLFYSQSLKLTAFTLGCATIAVIWQLGALNALGFGLDPFSILVPFLIFAIGVSHGVQMMRAYRAEAFSGHSSVEAARAAFRQLLVPGGVALLTDTLGFVTMLIIKIEVIRELAITASLGVAVILITNLFLLPILLSYVQLPDHYQEKIAARRERTDAAWRRVCVVMRPDVSAAILLLCAGLGWWAFGQSQKVRIGDINAGMPELRQTSRYNEDSRVITEKFSIGVDILSVIAEGGPDACVDYEVVTLMDQFAGHMRTIPGVQSIISLPTVAKIVNAGWNEGSLKWRILPSHPQALAQAVSPIETATGLLNADGSVMPIMIFLSDHRAETLTGVTDAVKAFAAAHPSDKVRFRLASGNAGVMAATNEVVQAAQYPIVFWVFGAVITLCLITFRSIRAMLCIVLPLLLVSYLGYALMVYLEIGLKTSTLPVVALGVGIGVDYGIYIFSRLSEAMREGKAFEDAMFEAFTRTGSAVVFTGLTLAIGVSTWIFSQLKFQADMGVLLTFMFLVNMIAAIIILPALARWLYRRPRQNA
ncbi:efflux RND transporter permease subunit [Synoicihabitans lomoniglobus]|uniref:MMPL family transporter n=1 Tax=Synoicihabitans lomoniglobus TaxID=2909285 RepID=A0AAF0CR34_9BACT|nr:MMPL family transporter [Opitutaceae bacterium LMO-M01]WED66426.1 MMPL family transporter [Opitutaceae bacterium LMO-M01]